MPSNLEPIYCVAGLLAFVIAGLLVSAIWRHFQPREEFSAAESAALRRQGNVAGCGIMAMWLLGGLVWGISQLVPGSAETLRPFGQTGVFIIAICTGIYLGISAIKDQISIVRRRRGWGWHPYPRGEEAMMGGTQLLIVIGAVLLIAWIIITAK